MPEDLKAPPVPEESVIRVLEQQSRHGMDQETMLIYINSINLMNLLSLIQRRYQGNTNAYLPLPVPSNTGAQPNIAGTGAGTGPSMENMLGMLMNMLGQGGGGMNPAALMSLLGPLLGQNADLAGMMKMLGNMFGKTGAGPSAPPAGGKNEVNPGSGNKEQGGEKASQGDDGQVSRETPKIIKWDRFEDRKRA